MKERKIVSSFPIPCMYDRKKLCLDCSLYSENINNLRKWSFDRSFRRDFGYYFGEFPTTQQVSALLFHFEDKNPFMLTSSFGWMDIPKEFTPVVMDIANERRDYVVNRFKKFNIEDYAFYVRCPNYR